MNAPWPYRIYPWVILHTIVVLSGCSEDDSALKNALETGKITARETEADSYTRPIGSLVVNSGDVSTKSTQVNVVIAAEDGIIMGYLLSNSSNTPTLSTAGWVSLVSKDRYNTTLTRTIPRPNSPTPITSGFGTATEIFRTVRRIPSHMMRPLRPVQYRSTLAAV